MADGEEQPAKRQRGQRGGNYWRSGNLWKQHWETGWHGRSDHKGQGHIPPHLRTGSWALPYEKKQPSGSGDVEITASSGSCGVGESSSSAAPVQPPQHELPKQSFVISKDKAIRWEELEVGTQPCVEALSSSETVRAKCPNVDKVIVMVCKRAELKASKDAVAKHCLTEEEMHATLMCPGRI